MAACPDNNDIRIAVSSPLGVDNAVTLTTPENAISTEVLNYYRQKYAQRNAVINELTNVAASNSPTGELLRPQDERAISAQSKPLTSMIKENDGYRQKRLDDLQAAKSAVAGLTRAEERKWQHYVFQISKKFINERADLSEYFWKYHNDTRYDTPSAQPMTQMMDSARPRIRAKSNEYATQITKLHDMLIPISKRTGNDIQQIYHDMGLYANARHILNDNVNHWLLDKWRAERDRLKTELEAIAANYDGTDATSRKVRRLQQDYNKYEEIIPYLEANLENEIKPEGLTSAGYTDAQARKVMADVLKSIGATREEAEAFSAAQSDVFRYITLDRMKAGLVSSEQLNAFPDWHSYVALMSANDNFTGPVNEAARYMQGNVHSRWGMQADPQSASISLAQYAQRAATEIGMQRFATHLYELARLNYKNRKAGEGDNGLRFKSYDELWADKLSGVLELQDKANDIMNNGGLAVDVQKPGSKPGQLKFERQYVYFEPGWKGDGYMKNITGMDLNKALTSDYKTESGLLRTLGMMSSIHGQMYTRASLGFPVIGGVRDGMERITHMTNRAFFTDDGQKLNNWQLIRQFIYNTPKALNTVREAFTKNPETWSEATRKYWGEFVSNGLMQTAIPSIRPEARSLADVTNGIKNKTLVGKVADKTGADFLNKWAASLGPTGRKAIGILDKWNNSWQNIGAFNQYMVFRDNGISAARAAELVLEPMNMTQKGTLTPYLRILAPFVVPTMQSAGALARTLGFTVNAKTPLDVLKAGRNGWAGVVLAASAYAALAPLMRESMGTDESGRKRFDNIPLRDAITSIPIGPFDDKGTFVKMPVGFGISRLGGILALGTERMMRGQMTPADIAAEMIFTTAKDVIPATMPQYKFTDKPGAFIMQLLTPDVLKPIMEVYGDTSYFGNAIANAPREGVSRVSQGRSSTNPIFHRIARMALQYGGIDAPPEYYKHLMQGYGAGPLQAIGAVFDMIDGKDNITSNSYDPDVYDKVAPWLRAIGLSMWVSRPRDTLRGMYYDYRRELNNRIQRAGLKLTLPENKGKKIDAAAYRRRILENSGLFTSEEIEDYELIRQVEQQFQAQSKIFNDKYKDAWLNAEYVDEVKDWFQQDHDVRTEILKNFIENSNYYRNRR